MQVCFPDLRFHRYYMRESLVSKSGTFKENNELKAHTLEALGIYAYKDHRHTVVSKLVKQPPGAK